MTSTGALAAAPGEALGDDRDAALTGPPASSAWASFGGLTLGAGGAGARELG
ncbi:hypothetical protein WMF38_20550 [Sorangium sp. So ce118]